MNDKVIVKLKIPERAYCEKARIARVVSILNQLNKNKFVDFREISVSGFGNKEVNKVFLDAFGVGENKIYIDSEKTFLNFMNEEITNKRNKYVILYYTIKTKKQNCYFLLNVLITSPTYNSSSEDDYSIEFVIKFVVENNEYYITDSLGDFSSSFCKLNLRDGLYYIFKFYTDDSILEEKIGIKKFAEYYLAHTNPPKLSTIRERCTIGITYKKGFGFFNGSIKEPVSKF